MKVSDPFQTHSVPLWLILLLVLPLPLHIFLYLPPMPWKCICGVPNAENKHFPISRMVPKPPSEAILFMGFSKFIGQLPSRVEREKHKKTPRTSTDVSDSLLPRLSLFGLGRSLHSGGMVMSTWDTGSMTWYPPQRALSRRHTRSIC